MSPLASSLTLILVLNQSHLPDTTVQRWVVEIQRQVHEDFAPIWHMDADVRFLPRSETPPPTAWQVRIHDGPYWQGGHHLCGDDHGIPYADVWNVPKDLKTDVTLSHEILEMLADPYDDDYLEDFPFMWFKEIVDPVEWNSYVRNGVHLADFVFPGWFDALTRGTRFDFLGLTDAPGHPYNGKAIRLDMRNGREDIIHG